MIKGTTAQFKLKLPCTKADLLWATMTVGQTGNSGTTSAPLPIIKRKSDCTGDDTSKELYFSLTALETARFSEKLKAYVQFRAQNNEGTVFGNRTMYVTVYPMSDAILDEDDPIIPEPGGEELTVLDAGEIV